MNQTEAIEIGREAIMVVLTMSVPIMAVALFVGLIIALFQALTQLQEMTLVFVPKIVVVFGALIFFSSVYAKHSIKLYEQSSRSNNRAELKHIGTAY